MDRARDIATRFPELFWDVEPSRLEWDEHRRFVIERMLTHGTWEQMKWLRETVGDSRIRDVIQKTKGRRLSPRQLRFWELILELPSDEVDNWLAEREDDEWNNRAFR